LYYEQTKKLVGAAVQVHDQLQCMDNEKMKTARKIARVQSGVNLTLEAAKIEVFQ